MDCSEEALPGRRSSLVRALGDATEQSEERVGDATQNGDDERAPWVLFDPGMVVFLEGDVERLVSRLDAPVSTSEQHPLFWRQSIGGKAGDDVTVFDADLPCKRINKFKNDGPGGRSPFKKTCNFKLLIVVNKR